MPEHPNSRAHLYAQLIRVCLSQHGPLTRGEIAQRTGLSPGQVHQAIAYPLFRRMGGHAPYRWAVRESP
jgi:winged helix-turn-helix DNA-binding protein